MPFRALSTFATAARDGETTELIAEGAVLPDGDSLVKVLPAMFERIGAEPAPVEQATAAPGEQRTTRRRG